MGDGCWMLDVGSGKWEAGSWVLGVGSWELGDGMEIKDTRDKDYSNLKSQY
ncbi:hypothetical protein [Ulvibacter antarcticus]|uniref:hypothetical protein n=1 Tax=Ulvibacter antarcticus TaxID=442714 RepID=UPI001B8684A4|nr:hypothetical protein [Ulvibacter antarcticus]